MCFFFFFNDTATTEIYTLSLHDALPIFPFGAVVYSVINIKLGEHIVALCQFIYYLLSNRYKLITNVRSSLMAVNIHIAIIELNALHTKRKNLFQEILSFRMQGVEF